ERGVGGVGLGEDDEVEALLLELGHARLDEVGAERLHAGGAGEIGETAQGLEEALLHRLVLGEKGHSRLTILATSSSSSVALRPPGPVPAWARKKAESANRRSAARRLSRRPPRTPCLSSTAVAASRLGLARSPARSQVISARRSQPFSARIAGCTTQRT